nr:hypothetical protein [uncultured Carboxylicivirga sp.]
MKHIIIILLASLVSYVAIGQNTNNPTFEETIEFLEKLLNNAQTYSEVEKFRYEVTDNQIVEYVSHKLTDEYKLCYRYYINLNEIDTVFVDNEKDRIIMYGIYPTSIIAEKKFDGWNKTSSRVFSLYTKNMHETDRIFKTLQHLAKLNKQEYKPLF